MSSSTWRVLNGYATYQRTPMRMTSLGKCAPLKLIAIVALLNWQHGLEGETIPQIASNENLRQNHFLYQLACDVTDQPWSDPSQTVADANTVHMWERHAKE